MWAKFEVRLRDRCTTVRTYRARVCASSRAVAVIYSCLADHRERAEHCCEDEGKHLSSSVATDRLPVVEDPVRCVAEIPDAALVGGVAD